MNLFWRLYDKATGVLGQDCDGKPLRAGDTVMITPRPDIYPEVKGKVTTVTGTQDSDPKFLSLALPHPRGGHWYALPECLRRIDPPSVTDWDQISRDTGWRPDVPVPRKTEEPAT